ncbi:MAG: zinc finger domain-containing protein [Sulfobacillus sp.]
MSNSNSNSHRPVAMDTRSQDPYTVCPGCRTTLLHPPGAAAIKCPVCSTITTIGGSAPRTPSLPVAAMKASPKANGYIALGFALGPLYNKGSSMKDASLPLAGEQAFKRKSILWTAWNNLGLRESWNEIAKELPGSKPSDIPTETKRRLAAMLREQILEHRDAIELVATSRNEIAKDIDIPTEVKRFAALLCEQILARHAAVQKANPTSDPRPCT